MLLRNEFRFLMRQPLMWLSCLLLPVFSVLLSFGSVSPDTDTAKQLLYLHSGLLMLGVPILVGALSPLMLMRDRSSHMEELIEVTPIPAVHRYLYRYAALTISCGVLISVSMMITTFILASKSGQLILLPSIIHILILMLPALAFLVAIALWMAKANRSPYSLYAVFGIIWIGYVTLASMTGSPILAGSTIVSESLLQFMYWFDPFGFTAYLEPLLNGDEASLNLKTVLNRLLFLVFSISLIFHTSRTESKTSSFKSSQAVDVASPELRKTTPIQYQEVKPETEKVWTTIELSRVAIFGLLSHKLNILILMGWSLLVFSEVSGGLHYAEAHAVLSPNSHDALNRVLWDIVSQIGVMLMLFWTWQLTWLNRHTDIYQLISSTPISNGMLAMSHWIALVAMLGALLIMTAIGSTAAEWLLGSDWRFSAYLVYLGMAAVPMLLITTLFLAINTWCRHKVIALLLCFAIVIVKFTTLSQLLGVAHPLWDIAGTPLIASDQQWGFSASITTFVPFAIVWFIIITGIFFTAIKHSHRSTALPPNKPERLVSSPWLIGSCVTLVLGFMHVQLSSEQSFIGFSNSSEWRAKYEAKYEHWQLIPQPQIIALASQVDIYPTQYFADFQLDITLTNHHDSAISEILVGGYANQTYDHVSIDGAELTAFDPSLNQYQFALSTPLLSGDTAQLRVKFRYQQPRLFAASMHQIVKPEFTYLRGVPIVPTVGFNKSMQLRNNQIRADYGLEAIINPLPSELFTEPNSQVGHYEWATMKTVLSTPSSQFGLAQGKLIKQWQEGTRRYFEYQTPKAIRKIPVWMAFPFTAIASDETAISTKVFSPETGDINRLHLDAMNDAISWFINNDMPNEFGDLNLVSMPDIGPTGYALPGVMLINHKVGFRARPSESAQFDQRYRRTVHETAHQWFGHGIGNGVIEDRAFLVESLAKYLELVLLEQTYGASASMALLDYETQRFKLQRANSQSLPLSLVDARHSFEMYSGATIVFSHLRQEVGDKPIIEALKEVWHQNQHPNTPATSMDFVRALKDQLPAHRHTLVDELFLEPLTSQSRFIADNRP